MSAPNFDKPIVSIENLSHRFGRFQALDSVSLTIRQGDVYGLLGLNGAGKTTTLRLIVGLVRAREGKIEVFGHSMPGGRMKVCPRIGATIEGPAFYPHQSGIANLRMLHRLRGAPASGTRPEGGLESEDAIAPEEAIEIVGLAEAMHIRVRKYSMGMTQRLYIAQALLGSPELIILDEPTNNLDPNGIRDVRELIVRLNRERGVTVLISSHQLSEVEDLCNRVAILHRGKRIDESEVGDLFESEWLPIRAVVDRPEEALRVMGDSDWRRDPRRDGNTIRVEVKRERRGELNTFLIRQGITVSEFTVERPTLEEYFHRRIAEDES